MASNVARKLSMVARELEQRFIGKEEVIRLLLISVIAGEHAVLIGPPGTAKSALIRSLARLVQASYFEYLLTRFTEPNEIFGPVDIHAFREGDYRRRTAGMLPESEIVFLDEVFKSNSAILNSLLTLLNERIYAVGGRVLRCPLVSVFGASNEVPSDETLIAIFDRFLLRVRSDNLDAYHFTGLLERGIAQEVHQVSGASLQPLVTLHEIGEFSRNIARYMQFDESFLSTYKGLVFQLRAEGVSLSDRRVVKMLKLFAASAFLDGRDTPDVSDLFLLKHIWNSEDQAPIVEAIVRPELETFYRERPERRRVGAVGVGVEALAAEIDRIRQILTGGTVLGDVQLFSQLSALNEIKSALASLQDPRARELERRVQDLLDASFKTGRFANL
ncbi:MAG: AAA family ATPase [Myxococcales bacterium]|nr:AAA family ATPase [Polyangiaceae bacterium]MDW8248831.1 AAA family ATPase [Myxococcales bacterium]